MYNKNRCKPYIIRFMVIYSFIGDVAQLGEYLNGIQGVRGSNPLISTNEIKGCVRWAQFYQVVYWHDTGTIEVKLSSLIDIVS